MTREFSAGGVIVRRFDDRPHLAAVRVRRRNGEPALALPKGHIDGEETAAEAAAREVREEAGLEGELVERLGDVRYWYWRDGVRVLKVVTFFLFTWRSGSVEDHDDEVESAEWVPLDEAAVGLSYAGERDMARRALLALDAR